MTDGVILYGAYGYTGELIARRAADRGVDLTLAGRNAEKLRPLGDDLGFETRAFAVEDDAAEAALADHAVCLNCAGPFAETYRPLVETCLETGTDYLDITGEIEVFEAIHALGDRASDRGVTLLPGVGFDVVPTDCLAAHLHDRLPEADELALAFDGSGGSSAGTTRTMLRNLDAGGAVRRHGRIKSVPLAWRSQKIDFGDGPRSTVTIPWGDVSTAYHSTGIENVEVYMAMHPKSIRRMRYLRYVTPVLGLDPVQRLVERFAVDDYEGPDAETRATTEAQVWGRVRTDDGDWAVSRLRTPNSYDLTVETVLAAARRTQAGEAPVGFQTPSSAFGADFVLEVDGVERTDLDRDATQ
ncbi:saccharopine dehydrogenase family protein [Halobacteriales archaeon Cl-PHB]